MAEVRRQNEFCNFTLLDNALRGRNEMSIYERAQRGFQNDQGSSGLLRRHYDLSKGLVLVGDVSPYGSDAFAVPVDDKGPDIRITFALGTLHASEHSYARLDREALTIMFRITMYKECLYGRKFAMLTDDGPLLGILHPQRQT